ncbi:hypothetical protein [Secundilactobacillus folii]|uniref:Uncharacterized protein n=1 Tax=Secundilactobacillus folii TaxID=2678357 RepID=A0A7X3C350_9LACO|nr:hypothetical protein [Secundilactobacillus folii]MTV82157.1 hypothetical protein [Secundilactobacillus folii]
MAHNVSLDEEIMGILNDVSQHRFREGRQLNPNSMLFTSVKKANDAGYLEGAKIDEQYSHSLASVDLSHATLTKSGQTKLQALIDASQA